jgi:hypothetical protein
MREDMSRVIVERPRLGGDRGRKGRAVPLDDLPKQEGMRRKHVLSGDCKVLNENLSPLRRYLERQVGRPWNKIYSEIARYLRADNTVQQHVRDHLSDFVAVRARWRFEVLNAGGGGEEPYDQLWFEPLYVDPNDGLLKRTDRLRQAKAFSRALRVPSTPPDRIGLAPDRELRRIDGLWFAVTLAPLPAPEYRAFGEIRTIPLKGYARRSPVIEMELTVRRLATPAVWDVVSGALVPVGPEIDEERAWDEYRRVHPDRRYAVSKRALSRWELRRHALSNLLTKPV